MITRIVKLTFRPEAREEFLSLFHANRESIAGFEGCHSLQLLHEKARPEVFFTVSIWESEAHLERYRHSALFERVWATTKTMFGAKPEAWTLTG